MMWQIKQIPERYFGVRRAFTGKLEVAAVVGVLAFCGCSSPSGFKSEYRMQVTVGSTTHWGKGAARFAELVTSRTGGRVKVKPYFGGQLLRGAQLNVAQMVATGAIDCAFESTINLAPVIVEMNIFSLPFFVQSFSAVDRLESGETGRRLFEAMRSKGLEPLAWGENGFRQLTNSRRRVLSPRDLKALRVRVVGAPIFIDIFRALGADPINMNWGDAVTAFQQGTVDGQENPVGILLAVRINQFHPYMILWNYAIDPLVLFWNKRQWDAFPDSIKTILREAAEEAAAYQKALARVGLDDGQSARLLEERFGEKLENTDPLGVLRAGGMTIDTLEPAAHAAFMVAVRPVYDQWIPTIGADLWSSANRDLGGRESDGE